MGYYDDLADKISESKWKVIEAKNKKQAEDFYEELKTLMIERILSLNKNITEEKLKELYCFDILDSLIYVQEESIETKPEYLVNILKIDKDFYDYCKHQTEYDGVVAALKYGIQIKHKKDIIKKALDLSKENNGIWL